MKTFYFAFIITIISKLENASVCSALLYQCQCHQSQIECVQKLLLKYLSLKTEGIYAERSTDHISLPQPLVDIRNQLSPQFLFKIIDSKIDDQHLLSHFYPHVLQQGSRFSESTFKKFTGL
jgi:hypothetical protein